MYKRILIVVDPRAVTRAAVQEGTSMAKIHGAEVVFFHVLPRYSVPLADAPPFAMVSPQEFQQEAKTHAQRILATASAAADKAGVMSRTAMGSGEDDAHCIVEAARKRRCDLIVVASEGRNALLRLLVGSAIPGLITASPVPVLICKSRPRQPAAAKAAAAAAKPRRAVARGDESP